MGKIKDVTDVISLRYKVDIIVDVGMGRMNAL